MMKILSRGAGMPKQTKAELVDKVILGARQDGISSVLFRNLVGERLDVNVTDMECLGLLFHKGIATPSELARHTGLSSGATTAMLDRLEQSGLIERRPNPDDRRGILIVLVKSGAKKVGAWFSSVRRAQNELVSSYSEEELQVLSDFFERSAKMWVAEREKLQKGIYK
jgi:DNA-binding MarR family transcriptional regulator